MPSRWNWNFDDARGPGTGKREAHGSADRGGPSRRVRIRRRRLAAGGLLAGVLAAAAVLVSGSGHSGPASRLAASAPRRTTRARAPAIPTVTPDEAVASVLAYTPFVKEGAARGRDVALTFDDGPGPYTPDVLSVLEHFRVRATFFVIGEMLRYFSASAVRELRDGDVIGDHTETHPEMATLSAREQHEELFEQIARVELLGGPRPVLFRPPYGSFDATTMRELHAMHLLMVLWSVDTEDYLQPGASVIVQRALAGAHPGAIILMHDAGGTRTQTVEALPQIIRGLRARGYRLVTVPELLRDDPPQRGQPLPSSLRGD